MIERSPDATINKTTTTLRPRGWKLAAIVTGLLLTLALSALDATIVGTALPTIARDLHGFAQYSWVVTAYLLKSTTMIPIVGKLSDLFGRKGFVLAGIVLFLAGSTLAGTAQSMIQLILFRGLQGMGAGLMQTLAFTLVADLFPPAERGRWQGLFASVLSLVLIAAPALGGWITDYANWRWVFYVNLPMGILALLLLAVWLPSTLTVRRHAPQRWAAVRSIDFAGAFTAAAATLCLLFALTWGGSTYPWTSVQIICLLGGVVVLVLSFALIERRAKEPLLPPALFRNQVFVASSLLALTLGMLIYTMIFYLPLFMQGVLGQTATNSGISLAPLFLPLAISALLGGQMITRMGRYHTLAIIGALILLAGLVLLARMGTTTTLFQVTLNMIIVGLGVGILQPIYTVAGQNAIPPERLGTGTGAMNYLRVIGSLVGTAVLGALATHAVHSSRSTSFSMATRQALVSDLTHVFLVAFCIGCAVLLITFFLRDIRLRKRGEEQSTSPGQTTATSSHNSSEMPKDSHA